MALVKLPIVIVIPGQAATTPQAGSTQCPPPAPPNNSGHDNSGNGSGGGPTLNCFFVPNQYGGQMEVCV